MTRLKIEYLKKDQLLPYANNAKIHTDRQIEQICQSIREFGFNDPIAIWKDNEVIEGHGRLLAVMQMDDIDKVPVIRLDDLSDEQRKAYMLVHNKLTMNTGFDLELLEGELAKVTDIAMDYYGFQTVDDIAGQLQDFFTASEPAAGEADEPATIKTFVFTVSPTEEDKGELISFLNREGFEYSEK